MKNFNEGRFSRIIIQTVLMLFLSEVAVLAANNPLNTIAADSFFEKTGSIKTEACSEGGRDVCSIHDGDYVVYRQYDFDSGVAAFKARIATTHPGALEIRLDGPAGPLMGKCSFNQTGGWQDWEDIVCPVDSSQAGVRDIYLVFRGRSHGAVVNISSFCFLKSIVIPGTKLLTGDSNRVDTADGEPQATKAWGMPEAGFIDDFASGRFDHWNANGLSVITNAGGQGYAVAGTGTNLNFALTPNVYINQTDTGGAWRTLAEASLAADLTIISPESRPGIGFSSKDGRQWIFVSLNAASNALEAWRRTADGTLIKIKQYPEVANAAGTKWVIQPRVKYRLQLDWSPYSDGLIVFLRDDQGNTLANFRTVIDLPAARRPLLVCNGGGSHFGHVIFDPHLDDWELKWEWKKTPVLTPDVCNPAVWKGKDGKYYMMWRKFGQDTYHGIAASVDGVSWIRVKDDVLKCTGDMNVVVDPFGDGLVYITPGSAHMPWWSSDGTGQFTVWKNTGLNLGGIYGNNRIQEIIDTKKYSQMTPVAFQGTDYRFIAFCENWTTHPQPHTVILLSNTLTNWVLADPNPVIPPGMNFWGEKGSAIGSAMVLPDGNILLASCSCTDAGYTGAPEPSNISAIVDGRQPWKVLKLGTLPDAPVSREHVWYEGPNFGTALLYDPENDTLFYYGGFHDYHIGVMRVRNFSHSKLFAGVKAGDGSWRSK
jgi:hypothetical protein